MFKRFTKLFIFFLVLVLTSSCAEEATFQVRASSTGSDVFLKPDTRVIEEVVPSRATLMGLFSQHVLDVNISVRLIDEVRQVFDPRLIKAGNSYRLVLGDDGSIRQFEYQIDNDQFLRVNATFDKNKSFNAELIPYVKELIETILKGEIDDRRSSLVASLNDAGENVGLAIMMAEVFSGEIDFNNDLRRGDQFEVLFEKYFKENQFAGYGGILATAFNNDGRSIQAFGFKIPGSDEMLYYDQNGRSVKRLFLRSPFRFEPRITSSFSHRRLHPILGIHRPHLGIDYGAPTGTPVIAVANGTVVSAERSGGSGNMVRLRHTNNYETYYLHLSSFAKGMRKGTRVAQGQLIGRVGSTGMSTGPHLDFRMRKNGTFVNPVVEHRNLPPGEPVPEQYLTAFRKVRDQALRRMHSSTSPSNISGILAQ
jgi:murein DD-endopeptidase MepM/ murein hydrolase activator NlpD